MQWKPALGTFVLLILLCKGGLAQQSGAGTAVVQGAYTKAEAPLPEPRALLLDVEQNDRRLEAMRKEYTYHVHLERQDLKGDGSVKHSEVIDSESLTLRGIRVNRVVARDGKPLTPEEQAKESERIDKEVSRAKERQGKAQAKGEFTDERGDTLLSAARILELGTFTHERRVDLKGRPTIVLDYAGDPNAKTRNAAEAVIRDLVGTVWIDEADHVLARGEGHFLNDFKVGGGLIADVRKGSNFSFETLRLGEGVWLPATIHGRGAVRVLLFAGFNGAVTLQTSDYRRFRTGVTILPGERPVDTNGNPLPTPDPKDPGASAAQGPS